MSHPPPPGKSSRRQPALLELARELPVLDATVLAFLDIVGRGSIDAGQEQESPLLFPDVRDGAGTSVPLLVYVTVALPHDLPREPALQLLAHDAGVAVYRLAAAPGDDAAAVRAQLDAALAGAASDARLDTGRLAIGGDGVGGAIALSIVLERTGIARACRLLLLSTPVLSAPAPLPGNGWLSPGRATALAEPLATIDLRFAHIDALELPPILLLTADVDPFRDGAEALARRLVAAGADVTALRALGTIHDFTWLPALTDSSPSADTRLLAAAALRRHLVQPLDKDQ